ncbi:hypothetical protein [Methylobrevis pamukkalensis]|uniref:hypothetical protein n=1 Tax=Methylobrevis pamukkalensis TaxID=1439726 RepID=UPI000845D9F7
MLGLAGNNVGDAVAYVRARLPFASAEIVSDGLIALQAPSATTTGRSRSSAPARSSFPGSAGG